MMKEALIGILLSIGVARSAVAAQAMYLTDANGRVLQVGGTIFSQSSATSTNSLMLGILQGLTTPATVTVVPYGTVPNGSATCVVVSIANSIAQADGAGSGGKPVSMAMTITGDAVMGNVAALIIRQVQPTKGVGALYNSSTASVIDGTATVFLVGFGEDNTGTPMAASGVSILNFIAARGHLLPSGVTAGALNVSAMLSALSQGLGNRSVTAVSGTVFSAAGGALGGFAPHHVQVGAILSMTATQFKSSTAGVESAYVVKANALAVRIRVYNIAGTGSLYIAGQFNNVSATGFASNGGGLWIQQSDGWQTILGNASGLNLGIGGGTLWTSAHVPNATGGNFVCIEEEDRP